MRTRHEIARAAAALACILALVAASPVQRPVQASGRVAASAGEVSLSMAELNDLLLDRHAFSPQGREILRHLVQTSVIHSIGETADVRVSQKQINRLWDQLDRDAKRSGLAGGMAAELERTGMTAEEFRDLLSLQILQQVLTRRALGLDEDARVSGDQMSIWIDAEIQGRGLEVLNPPWPDGVIASCGEVAISVEEYADLLGQHLPASEVRDAAFHALLVRGIGARMPDLAPDTRAEAIEQELQRRRREVEADAAYRGLPFESLLAAQGMTVEGLRKDPSLSIAALSSLWVDRSHDETGLRETFDRERSFFEDRYGQAAHLSALFLRGAKFRNRWNPRTFEEAEAELEGLRLRMTDLATFQEIARSISEDPGSKAAGGELGWVTRGEESVPEPVREAAFTFLGTTTEVPQGGALLGPVRLESGAVLVWLSKRRGSPSWEEMKVHVRQELRRRFLLDVLPRETVRTFRDS